jgi:TRAP-type mannitol/chloroaromatic compound transport system permease small subunit
VKGLLAFSRGIDALNEGIGRFVLWLVLAAVLISAGNAVARYGLDLSSNAWLEIQWYLFAAIFLFAAAYTLRHNGHVRIDVLYGRLPQRVQVWIDLFGTLLFLLPMCGLIAWLGWKGFLASYSVNEVSPDAGGLPRWPIKLAIPLGFGLLFLQGISEAIKRIAVLTGHLTPSTERAEEPV